MRFRIGLIPQRNLGIWETDEVRTSDKLDCLHGLHIPNENETSEELMETDEIGLEGLFSHEAHFFSYWYYNAEAGR